MIGDLAQETVWEGLPPMAVPMTVKIPEPMTAPMPRAVRETGPRDLFERILGALRVGDELVDGLGGEDLSGQGCVSSVKIYRIVMIVSGSPPARTFCEG